MRMRQHKKWIIVGIVFLLTFFAVSIRPEKAARAVAQMDDGVYTISGKLWHATQDQPSMGNAALSQPMKLVKTGDTMVLRISLQPISTGAWEGYLYGFEYYPETLDKNTIPEGKQAADAEVLEYYEHYDSYNQPGTGTDERVRGKQYPKTIQIPITQDCPQIWTHIYVPVMESLSKGSGDQFAKLILDWSTLTKTAEAPVQKTETPTVKPDVTRKPSATKKPATAKKRKKTTPKNKHAKTKTIQNLEDGTYRISGEMKKIDRKTKSMSDAALQKPLYLDVKAGNYSITMFFSELKTGGATGQLENVYYYASGYRKDKNGSPSGTKRAAEVLKRTKGSSGEKYPSEIRIPVIREAVKDGLIPLQVFVPAMEAISPGTGTQQVYLKLDPGSVQKVSSNEKTSAEQNTQSAAGKKNNKRKTTTKSKDTVKMNCNIAVSYRHPVTGTIEDAGGEQASATGQGMAESAIDAKGRWEKREDGNYQLTLKLHLMDYTSDHTFWIQNRGEETWENVSAKTIGHGQDENGTFSYVTLPVSCADPIVKISMYVKPMERNVIFYASLKNGETQESVTETDEENSSSVGTQSVEDDSEGLRLSTQKQQSAEQTEAQGNKEQGDAMTMIQWMITLTVSMCISGLILLAAAAAIVYYFRRNWRRWGEEMEDDDE